MKTIRFLSIIFFLLTSFYPPKKVKVPDLTGMKLKNAKALLKNKKIHIAAMITPAIIISDTSELVVYKQSPPAKNKKGQQTFIQQGDLIDIWLTDKSRNKDSLAKSNSHVRTVQKRT